MAQGAIGLLEADHQRVEGLFRNADAKLHLARIICMELTLHRAMLTKAKSCGMELAALGGRIQTRRAEIAATVQEA